MPNFDRKWVDRLVEDTDITFKEPRELEPVSESKRIENNSFYFSFDKYDSKIYYT